MDSFYKPLTEKQRVNVANYNFDHPDAFDWELLIQTIRNISEGFVVEIPTYDFVTHSRTEEVTVFYPGDIVMFEGILALYNAELMSLFNLKVFVSTDADIRVCRRLRRDIIERGRSVEGVLRQYQRTVKPSFDLFCAPTKSKADIIVPYGGENTVAIDLLVTHIRSQLHYRGRIDMKTTDCTIFEPTNTLQNRPKISLELITKAMLENDESQISRFLIRPYHNLIAAELEKAIAGNAPISVISLVPNPALRRITESMGIENFFIIRRPQDLIEVNPPTSTMTPRAGMGGFMEHVKNPEFPAHIKGEKVLQRLQGTHIFVLDGLTFTGNRVRATLLWLLENLGTNSNYVSVINMISSARGLRLLAHSFTYVEFHTLSELQELDGIWDLPAEGKFVRNLLGQESNV